MGYTDPEAGCDLTSLKMKAVEDGDDYVVNGQKTFGSWAHFADYQWLAVRTDPDAPKHKGISLLIVDLKSPGTSISPMPTIGSPVNVIYYDNVRVPKKNLVGKKNRGWEIINLALGQERSHPSGGSQRLFEDLVQYCQKAQCGGRPLSENSAIRQTLAQLAIEHEVVRLFGFNLEAARDKGLPCFVEAAMIKIFGSAFDQKLLQAGMQIMGL